MNKAKAYLRLTRIFEWFHLERLADWSFIKVMRLIGRQNSDDRVCEACEISLKDVESITFQIGRKKPQYFCSMQCSYLATGTGKHTEVE